jgi:hypothetical protein
MTDSLAYIDLHCTPRAELEKLARLADAAGMVEDAAELRAELARRG